MGALLVLTAAVLILDAYAATLGMLRGRLFGVRVYRPMLWNIVLSLVPVAAAVGGMVALLAVGAATAVVPASLAWVPVVSFWVVLVGASLVWILAFPNAAYLITELNMNHRRPDDPVPLWYDIVATLTLTLSGLANAVFSLGLLHLFALLLGDLDQITAASWLWSLLVLALGALGVYLGRYLRFNSWDVRHPSSMLAKSRDYFGKPGRIADVAGFVTTHTLLLAILYVPTFAFMHQALFPGAQ